MNQLSVYQLPIQGLLIQNHSGVMVTSIKKYQELLGTLVNSKLTPWNDCTGLRDLNSIHWKFS